MDNHLCRTTQYMEQYKGYMPIQTFFPGLIECDVEMLESDRASHSLSFSLCPMPPPSPSVSRLLLDGVEGTWADMSLVRGLGSNPTPPPPPTRDSRRDAVTPVGKIHDHRERRRQQGPVLVYAHVAPRNRSSHVCACVSARAYVCVGTYFHLEFS